MFPTTTSAFKPYTQALRAGGRSGEALSLADAAIEHFAMLGARDGTVTSTVFAASRSSLLIAAGRFAEGLGAADSAHADSVRNGDVTGEALSLLTRSDALAMLGRFLDARHAARAAEAVFARIDRRGFRRWAVSQRALVASMEGDTDELARAIEDLEAIGEHPVQLFGHTAVVATAAWRRANDDLPRALALLDDAAARMTERGDVAGAVRCLYERVRFGDAAVAEALARVCAMSTEPLHGVVAEHAVALAAGDAERVGEAARRFADAGARSWAVTAAQQAARLAAQAGDETAAATWTREANAWSAAFQRAEPRSTAQVASQYAGPSAIANGSDVAGEGRANGHAMDPIVPLTRREGEIANLAAQGLSSRSISERLFLSARTVENHLARVYTKLGIGSRAELAHALASA